MSGQGWMYSHLLDDRDFIFLSRQFITISDAIDYYGLGYRPLVRTAREAGAVYKIGKMVRISRPLLDEYLRKTRRIRGGSTCVRL